MSLETMDSGATIADWVSAFNGSKKTRAAAVTAFNDWVAGQPVGLRFGEFSGAEAEVQFVRFHMNSMELWSAWLAVLTMP
jgi:hypothetical protein